MAYLFVYHTHWLSRNKLSTGSSAILSRVAPTAIVDRAIDIGLIANVQETAYMENLDHVATIYFEDDGEATAFMMVQNEFLEEKTVTGLSMILEDPDWTYILEEKTLIQQLREEAQANTEGLNTHALSQTKRKFKKFKTSLGATFEQLSDEFKDKFDVFENDFMNEILENQRKRKEANKLWEAAKNRMRNRVKKFATKRVRCR